MNTDHHSLGTAGRGLTLHQRDRSRLGGAMARVRGAKRTVRDVSRMALLVAWLMALPTFGDDGYWDGRFHLPGIQGGDVLVLAVRDGEVYAGGTFESADRAATAHVARWNGANWAALSGGLNGEVNAIVVGGNDVFVGGRFTEAGGMPASRVARWDGRQWHSLGVGIGGTRVTALALDDAGTLYAGGEFTNAGNIAVANVARWDGTNWSALGGGLSNGSFPAWVLALATRGTELFAGGFFTDAGGASANCIARWDGTNWSALGTGVDDRNYLPQVTALATRGSDVFVGGAFATAGSVNANHVARWNGAAWSALGSGVGRYFGDIPVRALTWAGADLVAGGRFVSAGELTVSNLAGWNGSGWSGIGTTLDGPIDALASAGSNLLAGGSFDLGGDPTPRALFSWNGVGWSNLSAGGGQGLEGTRLCTVACSGDSISALAVVGRDVYGAGSFYSACGVRVDNVARWTGTSWAALDMGLDGRALALAADGSALLVAGEFSVAGSNPAGHIARWNGAAWAPVGSGLNGPVYSLAVDHATGSFVAGGAFSAAGAVVLTNIARWTGSTWTPLGGGVNGPVYVVAIRGPDVFAGGRFTLAGGVAATNVARWNGSTWSPLGGGVYGFASTGTRLRPPPVSALAFFGNDLWVGGDFAFAGGTPATNIARWNGVSWSGLGGGLPGVNQLAPPPAVASLVVCDDVLFVGGSFPFAGGLRADGLARWDGAGWSVVGGVTHGIDSAPSVSALAWLDDALLVGGHFKFAGGWPASDFSVWHSAAPTLHITRSATNVQLSWSADADGFVVEEREDLSGITWGAATNSAGPILNSGQWTCSHAAAGPSRFFRLACPQP